jgi:hypothetical protein
MIPFIVEPFFLLSFFCLSVFLLLSLSVHFTLPSQKPYGDSAPLWVMLQLSVEEFWVEWE